MQHIKGTAQVGDIELAYERWGKATDPAIC
jgi:hypothetical protein